MLDNPKSNISEINSLKRKLLVIIIVNNNTTNFNNEIFSYLDLKLIKKPFNFIFLKNILENINSLEFGANNANLSIPNMDKTEKTQHIYDAVIKILNNNLNVLITGEYGTGKKFIANSISELSTKKKLLEFSSIDYANNSFKNLLLRKTSFKDFLNKKKLKLDEISDYILFSNIDSLDLDVQELFASELKSKKKNILELFKNRKFIVTTNKNIKNSLRNNNFSNDLFYQLDLYNIFTIPIRERSEDIEVLVKSFINEFNKQNNTFREIHDDALIHIINYVWPGNIKQLKNFILRCLKVNKEKFMDKDFIIKELSVEFAYEEKNYLENWKVNFRNLISKNVRGYLNNSKKIDSGFYYKILKDFEKPLLIEILNFTNHNQLLSSEILGINRNTLRKKMFDYDIQVTKKTND